MDLGAPPRVAITRVLLPQIRPGITVAVIFVFIPVLGEYLTPQLVGGTRGVMIGNLIVNFFQGAEYTRGAAISLLIAAFIVVLLVVFRKQLDVAETYGR
jgi:ABC-type spermidine/putrescine transport system permease subunit I